MVSTTYCRQAQALGRKRHPFALLMRELRSQFAGKQLCFAVALGYTDAAVSMWESGKRLPSRGTMRFILQELARAGAPADHLAALTQRWMDARSARPANDVQVQSRRSQG